MKSFCKAISDHIEGKMLVLYLDGSDKYSEVMIEEMITEFLVAGAKNVVILPSSCSLSAIDVQDKMIVIKTPKFLNKDEFAVILKASEMARKSGGKKSVIIPKNVELSTMTDEELEKMGLRRL